ncbi:chemotaxis response regulator protein-glutamate methylesterase [Verrucomicrobium sp. BvORR106]|uniref:chemotaxis response regulator protein-glutamate methylesterase n=1 Tax=Verrucomicrobium sp. BvORR106 TaxID=1403819 RepID=UPI00056E1E2F|nr:chemotaxis response regulator protein-glutamate methylesterase [Verrucomicrobium sp. BvORR106]
MRIAIINDMAMAVEAVSRVLTKSGEHQVAWIARDGAEGVRRCGEDRPDLILMDIFMPVMDGVEATRQIMVQSPCPILIVTASVESHTSKVFEALGAGALDVVTTPVLGPDGRGDGGPALLAKIGVLSRLITGRAPRTHATPPPDSPAMAVAQNRLVVIGASAGGPAALAEVLGNLPPNFSASLIIVQHVDAQFASLMAKWLHGQSRIPVRLAEDGDHPEPGVALLAGTNDHLVFDGPRLLCYHSEPRNCSYRPSVDVFFESVVRHWKGEIAAALLTGMGRDGAKGLKALRDHGAFTVAQDQASCIVYGMPKAAVALGAAVEVLPLDQIGPRLSRHFPQVKIPSLA